MPYDKTSERELSEMSKYKLWEGDFSAMRTSFPVGI